MPAIAENRLPLLPPDYTLIVIGDAGHAASNPTVLQMLEAQLNASLPQRTGVLFMGDNIYPAGMPVASGKERSHAELVLSAQIEAVKDFNGEVWWLPGNHDWHDGKKGGYDRILEQERWIEQLRKDKTAFLPGQGCPGPFVEVLPQQLILLAFDSQAWMKGDHHCTHDHDSLLASLPAYVSAYPGLPVVIAAHHPLASDGPHGGRFGWQSHIFPLTDMVSWAYLPLPVIGSAYVLGRKWVGHPQDQSSRQYKKWSATLEETLATLPPSVMLSGHEHVQQVIDLDPHWQLVSGTGSESTFLNPGMNSRFASLDHGFLKVHFYPDGSVWVESWAVDSFEARGKLIGQLKLR